MMSVLLGEMDKNQAVEPHHYSEQVLKILKVFTYYKFYSDRSIKTDLHYMNFFILWSAVKRLKGCRQLNNTRSG